VISRAQGEADRFSKLVAEYRKAPDVTRERLYLETMQEVMGNTSKVLVTGDKGQNNLLYLPLDKMINSRGATSERSPAASASGASTQTTRLPPELDPREVRTREVR
jgi:modulator of FtsH protease HflK